MINRIGLKPIIGEHATRCVTKATRHAFGMVDLRGRLVHRHRWRRAGELEASHLADGAAPPVATNEVGTADAASACRRRPFHVNAVFLLHEALDITVAAHFDSKRESAVGQHGFGGLLIHWCIRRSGSFCTSGRIRIRPAKWPLYLGPRPGAVWSLLLRGLLHRREGALLCGGDGRGHPTTLQCFDSKRSDPPCLHDHARSGQTLQHKDAHAAQSQLDGGQEPDRPGSHNHNINLFFHKSSPRLYSVHRKGHRLPRPQPVFL